LLCEKDKLYKYGYDGTFMERRKLDFLAVNIEYNQGHLFFIGSGNDQNNLIVTDMDGHIKYENFSNNILGANTRRLVHPFCRNDSEMVYRIFLDDNIYGIKDNGELYVHYKIDFGDNAYTVNANTKSLNSKDLKSVLAKHRGQVKYFTENKNYAVFLFFDQNKPCIGIYKKTDGTTECFYYSQKAIDDFTGFAFPLIEYVSDGNELIAVLTPADIGENGSWAKKMSLSVDDNPVLYFIKTK
jgi:hypothetical protein